VSDLADLFPGFASHWIDTDAGRIFARSGGSGPGLLLLHGYPQSHVMWHRLAGPLAASHRVVAMDLRGYGWSAAPRSKGGTEYAKREMAKDAVEVMRALGHTTFALIGHDRGARVGYRLALDHPGRLTRLALLDIMPTLTMWQGMDAKRAMQVFHWMFLAQPEPLPELLIGKAPADYLDLKLASWSKTKDLSGFAPSALAHYRAAFANPDRIHASCEDYRAGATLDVDADAADLAAGNRILCPTLILWGAAGIPAASSAPLDVWRSTFAPQATGNPVDSGHFLPEEAPEETLQALQPFLAA
jgi:haloacetate dehalogenase